MGANYNTGGVISHNSNLFIQEEYTCLWGDTDDYDHPIHTVEQDNKKILLYELIGLSKDNVIAEVEFVNKTKQTYLNIKGDFEDELTGWKNDVNIHLPIDTNTYDGYSWHIENGMLTIILDEIINSVPKFEEI